VSLNLEKIQELLLKEREAKQLEKYLNEINSYTRLDYSKIGQQYNI